MKIAIYACDYMYGGLHGIEDFWVGEVNDLKEAETIGGQMSRGVISSFDFIEEDFNERAEEEGIEFDTEEYWNRLEELIVEDIEYYIYIIKNTDKSDKELYDMFYNDKEEFIENYCEEV